MGRINVSSIGGNRRATNTPVQKPISTHQVLNNTGGHTWQVDDFGRLNRFLILGVEGGTYYAQEQNLLKQNHDAVIRCIKADGVCTVNRIVEVSDKGLAYKNDPALLALALVTVHGDAAAKAAAYEALPKVARTGTHLLHFAAYVNSFRGWGRGLRKAVARWYVEKEADKLAYQAVKYQQRDGWSHRDLLRLSHPVTTDKETEAVFRWMVGGMDALAKREVKRGKGADAAVSSYGSVKRSLPDIIEAFEEAKTASTARLVELITEHNLPREAIPTEKLNELPVWEALLETMPLTAMVRNLGKMTNIGLIKPLSQAAKLVRERLANSELLRKSRIHPMQVLIAAKVYGQGRGSKGSLSWSAVPAIEAALDKAFYASFPNVEPCGKGMLIALDVSGSMNSSVAGATCLTACEAVAGLSLVHANVEDEYHIFGFADTFRDLGIRKGMTLTEAYRRAQRSNFGSTDCSLAIQYAIDNKLEVGGFVTMTDNEVNTGRHPAQALREYRSKFNPEARNVVVATTSTPFSVNDPNDRFGLDVVGFDASAPKVIADFIRGKSAGVEQAD